MEINTDMTKVKESKCFGIAWDGEVKECKICEVANQCKQRTMGGQKQAPAKSAPTKKVEETSETSMKPTNSRPEPKPTAEKAKKAPAKKAAKSAKTYDPDMPDFKPMSVDELLELAKERGIDPADFDSLTNTGIKKMRVTMALKKTYEQ